MAPVSRTPIPVEAVRLRPLRTSDEAVVRAAHQAMSEDNFTFGLGLTPDMAWSHYLSTLEGQQRGSSNLPDGIVAATYLVAIADGQVVGRTSIRHTLNDSLRRRGHISYGVLAQFRRRGYGTAILGHSLTIARALGIDRALITCDEDNVGSQQIESCGGALESVEPHTDGTLIRRYWID
ncbi:GNAT family N-acetyltransferase [Nocardia nepalensis]|uniref:GNAT family N-acetyltransferase n=1 Tax=Nocardia nepalensis TaxID=3375448 RepID=UPI003B683AF9